MLRRFADEDVPRGCLATMAAMEPVGQEGAIGERIASGLKTMHGLLLRRCVQAVSDGELPTDTECAELAALLTSIARGIAVLDRSSGGRHLARLSVDAVLAKVDGMLSRPRQ